MSGQNDKLGSLPNRVLRVREENISRLETWVRCLTLKPWGIRCALWTWGSELSLFSPQNWTSRNNFQFSTVINSSPLLELRFDFKDVRYSWFLSVANQGIPSHVRFATSMPSTSPLSAGRDDWFSDWQSSLNRWEMTVQKEILATSLRASLLGIIWWSILFDHRNTCGRTYVGSFGRERIEYLTEEGVDRVFGGFGRAKKTGSRGKRVSALGNEVELK